MGVGRVKVWLARAAGAVLMIAVAAAHAAAQGGQGAQDAQARQDAQNERRPTDGAVEGMIGHAAFADESAIHHSVFGVAAPLRVTKRLAVGPTVVRLSGPGVDRDWILAGGIWWDFISPGPLRRGRVVPFASGELGLFSHHSEFGSNTRFYYGGGAGVRVHLTDRLYIAPEVLFASELSIRTVARIGYHIPRSR